MSLIIFCLFCQNILQLFCECLIVSLYLDISGAVMMCLMPCACLLRNTLGNGLNLFDILLNEILP